MSVSRFTAVFALVGVLLAFILNAFWSLFERSIHAGHYYSPIYKGTLLLFPPSIGTIAISGASYCSPEHFVLIGLNGVFYAIFGLLAWLGLRAYP
jgi:hypothetical protein